MQSIQNVSNCCQMVLLTFTIAFYQRFVEFLQILSSFHMFSVIQSLRFDLIINIFVHQCHCDRYSTVLISFSETFCQGAGLKSPLEMYCHPVILIVCMRVQYFYTYFVMLIMNILLVVYFFECVIFCLMGYL